MTDRSKVDDIIQSLEDLVDRKQKMKIQIEKLGEEIPDLARKIHGNFKKMNLLNDALTKLAKKRSERRNNNNVFLPNNSLKVDEIGDWDDVYEDE
uniref:P53 and DNA damage-regulated protein 1 n=1 Tax=Strongyloides papillosus TaxID=174720 RepID=A0A0N5CIU7_STREA